MIEVIATKLHAIPLCGIAGIILTFILVVVIPMYDNYEVNKKWGKK